ncbi:chalcone isomerase family protein [Glaciimonas sp. PAMC28666]|uniref:chalcone isomerase family protein n=1 Tax=Glaciimonas sp. PAMC28666 TaxID=2807626 RepID=UPI0019635F29|nr:chalcone isomerase family protein [Glaciimonas sp. PAMC28666]QRX83940.1 chalcone isomerase family protein [Glaciimonas sp. PAMC28666]
MLLRQIRLWCLLLVCTLATGLHNSANAASPLDNAVTNGADDSGSAAQQQIQNAIPHARLAGQGRYRWFGLSIYDAQLWVGDKGFQTSAPAAASFALDLRYNRSFKGTRIAESSIDQMRKIDSGSEAEYGPWLSQLKAIFPNVIDGSHVTGIFLPGIGTQFYMNGKLIGEIHDPHFSAAFFGIWLSPGTTASGLRKQLLANATATPSANSSHHE